MRHFILAAVLALTIPVSAQAHFVGLSYAFRGCPPIDYDATGVQHYDAGTHKDLIHGTQGTKCQSGTNPVYDDEISGKDGPDELYGENGFDRLEGGHGGDYLHGGANNDQIFGGPGDDTIICAGGTNDSATGGGGIDTYSNCENIG